MATGRGWILRQHSLGFVQQPSGSATFRRESQLSSFGAISSRGGILGHIGTPANQNRAMSESTAATDKQIRKLQIPKQCKKSAVKSTCTISLDRMPSEILLKILSYLDVATLLCTGCVNKTFYFLSNDNTIWFKIYSKYFMPKRKKWMAEPIQDSLKLLELQDKGLGYWKKEYILKRISDGKANVIQLLKPVNAYTGLPLKTKEAIKLSGLKWMLILKDRNGKEHKMHQTNICFNETSVTIFWYNSRWPCLDTLLSLQLFGITPVLLNETKVVPRNGPWLRSLVSEYKLSDLTKNAEMIGCDAFIELYCFEQELLVGFWKKNEIAFVMASLHYHQLIERSTLGSATVRHTPTPDKAILDDIDPLYGTHGFQLHIDLHNSGNAYMCGTFRNLFCQKDNIRNGYLQFTVISFKNTAQHVPLVGNVGLCWRTDAFEGSFQNCFIMDVTLLDDSQKPFWCFSAPVNMVLSPKPSTLYQYLGPSYFLTYVDSAGKVHMELVWMEETNEYCIINLDFYLSAQKVNSWFGTNY